MEANINLYNSNMNSALENLISHVVIPLAGITALAFLAGSPPSMADKKVQNSAYTYTVTDETTGYRELTITGYEFKQFEKLKWSKPVHA